MKIKEGGGMDVQDKAFREWFAQYENNIEYASEKIAWDAWQAAKAQADQKIKLLLCDEHLKKCESPTGVFNSQYSDEEPCLICLAKQAKAQAVPEGFGDIQSWIAVNSFSALDASMDDFLVVDANELAKYIDSLIEAQEPTND
ncbi:hypothetical protein [Acinetobacter sp. YH12100]|uniref:hypothetical protein n=1 Tax=Acinetobacter sp. YH12100 TaxID=2601089 RepID=UPI0015D37094|nr:hypothetical protein [Acinetobacter sp. YH12100]